MVFYKECFYNHRSHRFLFAKHIASPYLSRISIKKKTVILIAISLLISCKGYCQNNRITDKDIIGKWEASNIFVKHIDKNYRQDSGMAFIKWHLKKSGKSILIYKLNNKKFKHIDQWRLSDSTTAFRWDSSHSKVVGTYNMFTGKTYIEHGCLNEEGDCTITSGTINTSSNGTLEIETWITFASSSITFYRKGKNALIYH